ncbi:MAG: hypothetical protein LBQ96_08780 [Fusobacteriaceae bacterium]|jgi:predicted Holliday junction resolvase-like endonuclease|nr:hypothetical protein [Fusobacteriaceae bacterium]
MKRIFFVSLFVVTVLIVHGYVKIQIAGLERRIAEGERELAATLKQLDSSKRTYDEKASLEKIEEDMQKLYQMKTADSKSVILFEISDKKERDESR